MATTLSRIALTALPAAVIGSTSGYAVTYLTVEEAQAAMFPGARLEPVSITLTPAQRRSIEKASGIHVRQPTLQVWRADTGGWFFVDQVIGKHEFITYALALSNEGAVRSVEILDYRETYGGEIRSEKWRDQFVGKTETAPLKLDRDIKNISGATLSCRNVTDGIKRLLATHALVLSKL